MLESYYAHKWILAMSITDDKKRKHQVNERSLDNLKLGPESRRKDKQRRNMSLLPETIKLLEKWGNASDWVDKAAAAYKAGRIKLSDLDPETCPPTSNPDQSPEVTELRERIAELEAELQRQSRLLERKTALPDLFAARDKILDKWRLAKRAESKERLREFANKLIEEIIANDIGYTFIQRLMSDLDQERKFQKASSETMLGWHTKYIEARDQLKQRGVNLE